MKISLPDATGRLSDYRLTGTPIPEARLPDSPARIVYSAAHVVADPVRGSAIRPVRPGGLARGRWPSAITCTASAWALPRRWIPRSAAWGSTGPARWN